MCALTKGPSMRIRNALVIASVVLVAGCTAPGAVAETPGMCGRTSLFVPKSELEDRFEATVVADGGYRPRYNIAPGSGLEVVTNHATDAIDRFHWGLVPPWAEAVDDGGTRPQWYRSTASGASWVRTSSPAPGAMLYRGR